jgi:SAM-dependent methyltransferase
MKTIEYKGVHYPALQAEGFASQYAFPLAYKVIQPEGKVGYDIGCNRKEWAFPPAVPIDPAIENCIYDAMNLPEMPVDYIFSSHMLEHIADWVSVIDYWWTKLVSGGQLFLYLPHPEQFYWWPQNNRKHFHLFFPEVVGRVLNDRGWKNVFITGHDLNYSFYAVAEKP